MKITLRDIIGLAKGLPEAYLEEAFEKLQQVKEKADSEKEPKSKECPRCCSVQVVRNGKRNGKQAYLCRECNKTFVETSGSAIAYSNSGETVWKQVILDTVNGVSIDETAESLDLAHSTVFNMRHKILYCVESSLTSNPVELSGVCETDETYVLESVKGRKIPAYYHRKPRKHGAKALKRGISEEYVCVCTSVTGDGENVAKAVNRAIPSSQEILDVFGERVVEDTVVLCDGNQSYNVLDDICTVATAKRINKVNGFHSFMKNRLNAMRGVATIYLNRYNALFAKLYAADNSIADEIYELMTSVPASFKTIAQIKSDNLLSI
jgi:transposase-like protein